MFTVSPSRALTGLSGIIILALGAAACSASTTTRVVARYASEAERPACTGATELEVAFAVAEKSTAICSAGAWLPVSTAGASGAAGATGATGATTAAFVTTEPPGSKCPQGGTKVVVYTDKNANGALDSAEEAEARTVFFCHGATGDGGPAGAVGATGAQGATGASGVGGPGGASGATGAVGATGATGPGGATGATGLPGTVGTETCAVTVAGVSQGYVNSGSGTLACSGRFSGSVSYVCSSGSIAVTGACGCSARYTGTNCASCVAPYVPFGDVCVPSYLTFTKANNADPALATNQDCIRPDVCITRGANKSIYNAAYSQGPTGANDPSCLTAPGAGPAGTRWAKGPCGATTTPFDTFLSSAFTACNPTTVVDVPACLYLPAYGAYYDITFTSWTANAGGGGFAYVRSAVPSIGTP